MLKYLTVISITLLCCTTLQAEQYRSYQAKAAFKSTHPCPSTGKTKGSCPNYIIGHIDPLACGGEDDASNMQWQTKAEANIKAKWERKNCK
jgi:hypothetical protein